MNYSLVSGYFNSMKTGNYKYKRCYEVLAYDWKQTLFEKLIDAIKFRGNNTWGLFELVKDRNKIIRKRVPFNHPNIKYTTTLYFLSTFI